MSAKTNNWITMLSDKDQVFIKRLILASGSLKEIAKLYNITYPTVRLRLDRLITKIEVIDQETYNDDYEELLREKYADNKIDVSTFKNLLKEYRKRHKKSGNRYEN